MRLSIEDLVKFKMNQDDYKSQSSRRMNSIDKRGTSVWSNCSDTSPVGNGLRDARRYWAALSIWCAIILTIIDASIASVALPFISKGLQLTAAKSVWVINAYQIAIVMALLPMAKVSDILGYKKVYLSGILLFMIAASGSIFAGSLTMLAVARFVQGIGAAAVMVTSGALVRSIYPPELVTRGIAYNTIAVSFASASGPAACAVVLSFANWHAVFAVGLPFGLLALALGWWALPSTASAKRSFDTISALMCCLGFAAGFSILSDLAQNSSSEWTFVKVGVAVSAIFFLRKRTSISHESMVPLDLLKMGSLRLAYGMSASAYAVMILITLSFPFVLQQRLHFGPESIGMLMVPLPIGIMIAAFVAGRLVNRFSSAGLCSSGLISLAGGAICLSFIHPGSSVFLIIAAVAICGLGFGIFQVPNNHSMLATAPHSRAGAASAMLSLSRLIGQTLGALLAASLFRMIGAQSDAPIVVAAFIALTVASITLLIRYRTIVSIG